MLASEKISTAFLAIIEEAEKLRAQTDGEDVQAGLKTIISIAKHQSDIRNARQGECKAHSCEKTSE